MSTVTKIKIAALVGVLLWVNAQFQSRPNAGSVVAAVFTGFLRFILGTLLVIVLYAIVINISRRINAPLANSLVDQWETVNGTKRMRERERVRAEGEREAKVIKPIRESVAKMMATKPETLTVVAPDIHDEHAYPGAIQIHYPNSFVADDPRMPRAQYIERLVSARLGVDMVAIWDRRETILTLRPRPPLELFEFREDWRVYLKNGHLDAYAIPIGRTDPDVADPGVMGEPVACWRMRPSGKQPWSPSVLISGMPGHGKSVLLNGIASYVVRVLFPEFGHTVWILDGKGTGDFSWLLGRPGFELMTSSADQAVEWSRALVAVTKHRYDVQFAAKVNGDVSAIPTWPGIVAIVDEVVQLGIDIKLTIGKKAAEEFIANLSRVAALGRQANVWLIEATQRADAGDIGGSHRDTLEGRIALGQHTDHAARMALKDLAFMGSMIQNVPGRGLYAVGEHASRLQVPFVPDPVDPETSKELAARILDAMPELDVDWRTRALSAPFDAVEVPALATGPERRTCEAPVRNGPRQGEPCGNPVPPDSDDLVCVNHAMAQ